MEGGREGIGREWREGGREGGREGMEGGNGGREVETDPNGKEGEM